VGLCPWKAKAASKGRQLEITLQTHGFHLEFIYYNKGETQWALAAADTRQILRKTVMAHTML
jgi:hypothetical protein